MRIAEQIADRVALLELVARERGFLISGDGYVCEAAAASLIGIETGTLRNWRGQHEPLRYRRLGGPRGRVWYPLTEIARLLVESEDT
jgi:hypothetical protein